MSGIVPNTQQGAIDFFSSRLTTWAANAAAIGLSAQQVTDIATMVNTAQTKLGAAQASRNASRTATLDLSGALDAMRGFGGDLIKSIRSYAETTGDPDVYLLSNIPPVAPPTPLGPPKTPTDLTAALNNDGNIALSWKGTREGGTSFRVERSITPVGGATSPYTLINVVEERTYVDTEVPQGVAIVQYQIKAQRSGGTSVASEPAQVTFGTTSGSTSSASSGSGLSLAA